MWTNILNFFYDDPGLYALQQQVYNEFGCQDTVSFRFEIIDELAIGVFTAFTPIGDSSMTSRNPSWLEKVELIGHLDGDGSFRPNHV